MGVPTITISILFTAKDAVFFPDVRSTENDVLPPLGIGLAHPANTGAESVTHQNQRLLSRVSVQWDEQCMCVQRSEGFLRQIITLRRFVPCNSVFNVVQQTFWHQRIFVQVNQVRRLWSETRNQMSLSAGCSKESSKDERRNRHYSISIEDL